MEIKTIAKEPHDVVVVGGGIAGVASALAVAREGKSVLLIEKGINLGGLATVGLISWYEPLCDGKGDKMISGIAEELILLACSVGYDDLPIKWGGKTERKNERYAAHYSPTFFAIALEKLLLDNGVELLYDSRMTYPQMDGNVVTGVIVENVGGREFYPAKVVIDATGDATVMHRAGVPTVVGDNFLSYTVHAFDYEDAKAFVEKKDMGAIRRWKGSGSDLWGNGHPQELGLLHGVTAQDVTKFVIEGKQRLYKKFEGRDKDLTEIMTLPTIPQYRKIRRFVGDTTFMAVDGEKFSDSVGSSGDFRYPGKRYEIPYSCLYNSAFPNLLGAGRIVSADGDGWEVTRVIPVCALTGEVTGIASAIAIENGCSVAEIDYSVLRARLIEKGVAFNL